MRRQGHKLPCDGKNQSRRKSGGYTTEKKRPSVREYHFKFVDKNYNRKSLEGKFEKKIQTAVSGTEHNVNTETGTLIHRNIVWN